MPKQHVRSRQEKIRIPTKTALTMVLSYAKRRIGEQLRSVWFIVAYLVIFQTVVLRVPVSSALTVGVGRLPSSTSAVGYSSPSRWRRAIATSRSVVALPGSRASRDGRGGTRSVASSGYRVAALGKRARAKASIRSAMRAQASGASVIRCRARRKAAVSAGVG